MLYVTTLLNIPYFFYFNRVPNSLLEDVIALLEDAQSNFRIKSSINDLFHTFWPCDSKHNVDLVKVTLSNVINVLKDDYKRLKQFFSKLDDFLPAKLPTLESDVNILFPTLQELIPVSDLKKSSGFVDKIWGYPRPLFQIFVPNENVPFETVVPITTYEGQLLNDIITDLVEGLEFNRKEVATQIITLDLFFKKGFFTVPGIPLVSLNAEYQLDKSITTYKIEDTAIETVLGLLFKLPVVSHPVAYFYALLVEICQNSPSVIAPIFGRAFRYFYNNLETLDFELQTRFLEWFSFQIGNFEFAWKWQEWQTYSQRYSGMFYNSKVNFSNNLLRKIMRMTSNTPMVEEKLPEYFKTSSKLSLLSPEDLRDYYQSFFEDYTVNSEDLKPNDLYFRNSMVPMNEAVNWMKEYIQKHPTSPSLPVLENALTKIKNNFNSIISKFDHFSIVLLIHMTLYCGKKALSLTSNYILGMHHILKGIFDKINIPQIEKEFMIVEAILRFWNSNPHIGFLVTEMFLFHGFVSIQVILQFIFNDYNGKVYGLVDESTILFTFRILDYHTLPELETFSPPNYVFKRLVSILNDTAKKSQKQGQKISNSLMSTEKYDLTWKYHTVKKYLKYIYRTYGHILIDQSSLDNNLFTDLLIDDIDDLV